MTKKEIGRTVPQQTHHKIMWESGYVPASVAAEAIGRDLSTIHRWVKAKKIGGVRSDRRLFVLLDSLFPLFSGNPVIVERLRALNRGEWLRAG